MPVLHSETDGDAKSAGDARAAGTMRALQLKSERELVLIDVAKPPPPGDDEIQIRIKAVALNHIDVWGWRGMAFARRKLPVIIGAEAAGEVVATGAGVTALANGQIVALYGARTCNSCTACLEGRDNLCEDVGGIHGFHLDGFAQELVNMPARLAVPAPDGIDAMAAVCAPVTFGTVEHMLFDNAKLKAGETILIQAGGSGIGTAAIQMAKAVGATVITTVGSDEKARKALELGADHVINYREERFEGVVRKLTKKKGVDVVFEHVGADTWAGSMFSLRKGGRLVTCGSTTGLSAEINLFQLFQQQLRIFGSFGCSMRNMRDALDKLAQGTVHPVIDAVIPMEEIETGLQRLEDRDVFGKLLVAL
ncbi:putative zinc-type alcohol dehydrogenase-like protein YjmD [bacterium BMS3Bbin10]|nr:putative zinc-type alcohol dehydrogenase-like protein YjmD [bacterium BMS3Bbin10]